MILMQMSVEGQDGKRLCVDVDIDPNSEYDLSLGARIAKAVQQLLPHAAPSEPPSLIVTDLVN
jgi:hypothetical protein